MNSFPIGSYYFASIELRVQHMHIIDGSSPENLRLADVQMRDDAFDRSRRGHNALNSSGPPRRSEARALDRQGFEYKQWWRRGELNPRPKTFRLRPLHA